MTDNAPERIFLQDDGDYAGAQAALSDLTWCVDQINDGDTEYIRLDLYTAVCAERDDLRGLSAHLLDMGKREVEIIARYDAKLDASEAAIAAALKRLDASLFTNAEHQQAKDILRGALKEKPDDTTT